MSKLLPVTEWAKLRGVDGSRVRRLAAEGRLEGAQKVGSQWVIPEETTLPPDARVKSGQYRNWRKPKK